MMSAQLHPVIVALVVDGPLTASVERAALAGQVCSTAREAPGAMSPGCVGATVRFEGIVRGSEPAPAEGGANRDLQALDYQTYDPMAERQLRELAREMAAKHGLGSLIVLHSRGRVGVGEVSFVLIVKSPHRAEALAAMAEFIDRLKQDVPIWKRPVWA